MEIVLIITAFLASVLTFFSGFGLGTILLAVMLIYFPSEIAIGLTAIVHLANNLFKWMLTRHHMDFRLVFSFGLMAIPGALLGAASLKMLNDISPLFVYKIGSEDFTITFLKIMVGMVMIFFACWEWIPSLKKIQFNKSWFYTGGFLTGYFGGLTGHQGALRSAFLVRGNLDKNTFIASGVAIACLVDIIRIPSYITYFKNTDYQQNSAYMLFCILAALSGSILGNFALKKVTDRFIQNIVAVLLILMGLLLITGII